MKYSTKPSYRLPKTSTEGRNAITSTLQLRTFSERTDERTFCFFHKDSCSPECSCDSEKSCTCNTQKKESCSHCFCDNDCRCESACSCDDNSCNDCGPFESGCYCDSAGRICKSD